MDSSNLHYVAWNKIDRLYIVLIYMHLFCCIFLLAIYS